MPKRGLWKMNEPFGMIFSFPPHIPDHPSNSCSSANRISVLIPVYSGTCGPICPANPDSSFQPLVALSLENFSNILFFLCVLIEVYGNFHNLLQLIISLVYMSISSSRVKRAKTMFHLSLHFQNLTWFYN